MAIKSRAKYTSKGGLGGKFIAGGNIEKSVVDVHLNKWKAFKAGKTVYMTVPNPNDKETAKRFVRVKMSDLYGDSRNY